MKSSGVALVFGESENDTRTLAELIQALCPELEGRVVTRRKPLVLIRNAGTDTVGYRAKKLAAAVKAESATRSVACVFAHEDADDVEPAHEKVAQKIEWALFEAGCPAHAAVPAAEIEAWLLLFPTALKAFRNSWSEVESVRGRHTGMIQDAKERLIRLTRGTGREYRESDAPLVAKTVRQLGLADAPEAISKSYDDFRTAVEKCCAKVRV